MPAVIVAIAMRRRRAKLAIVVREGLWIDAQPIAARTRWLARSPRLAHVVVFGGGDHIAARPLRARRWIQAA